MGIVNRTLDASEQKDVYVHQWAVSGATGFVAGSTLIGAPMASAGTLDRIVVTCQGASTATTSSIEILRFIGGAGFTTIVGLGASFVMPIMGISGALSVSLAASGSTLLNVLPGDCVQLRLGVNGAQGPAVTVVVKKTQEIVSRFGSQT